MGTTEASTDGSLPGMQNNGESLQTPKVILELRSYCEKLCSASGKEKLPLL